MASSLLDYIEEQRRKQEEEARAKAAAQAAAAKYSRVEKDDVYVPPAKVSVPADDRQQAIQEKRADLSSIAPKPVTPTVNKTYLPVASSSSIMPEAAPDVTPSQSYGPAAPAPSSGVDDALQSWRQKPAQPTESPLSFMPAYHSMSSDLQVGVDDAARPSTGAAGIGATGVTQIQPNFSQPTAQQQNVQQPGTRDFLNANALTGNQPYANYAVGAQQNVGWLNQYGPGVAGAMGNQLGQYANQANDYLKKWGLDWQNPTTPTQQPGQTLPGQTPLNTNAPQIGATGNTSDTLGINVQTPAKPLESNGQTFMDWYKQTPSGQYTLPKIAEANQKGGFLGNLSAIGEGMNVPFQLGSQTPIPGTGKYTGGTDVSAAQILQPALTTVARAINPFDTHSVYRNDQESATPTGDYLAKKYPNLNEYIPLKAFGWMYDKYNSEANKQLATQSYLNSLPPEQKQKAQIALNNVWSGPESVQKTIDSIQNQPQAAQNYIKLAQQAQAIANDPTKTPQEKQQAALDAAKYGNLANEEKNYSALDYVDKYKHPGAELVADLIFNPVNYAMNVPFEKATELYQGWKYAKLFNITPEAAEKAIPKALEEAERIIQQGIARQAPEAMTDAGKKAPILARTAWEKINPLAPTAETKAQVITTQLFDTLNQLIGKATNKQDAQQLVTALINDPLKLVQGVTGLTSPEFAASSVDGLYKVGAGVVANKNLLGEGLTGLLPNKDNLVVLKLAADKLLGSESLAGEGVFSAKNFMVDAEKALYDTAREAITGGEKKAATSDVVLKTLDFGWKLQKGLLSDMYLALSPANWIRNAASGNAHLQVDGIGNLHSKEEMLAYMENKLGMVPERGLFNALGGTEPDIAHWSEKLFGKDNLYSKLVSKGNEVRGGFGTIGNLPTGENAMRLLAYYNGFTRSFGKAFKGAVSETFEKGLINAGVDADIARTLGHIATEAGTSGDKAGLVTAVRDALTNKTLKPNLRELGIPDELISMDGWSKIHDLLANYGPEQADEAAGALRQVFTDELKNRAKILNEAPPQLGNYKWTNTQAAQDSAGLIDNLRRDAAAAGIPKDQAEAQAQALAKKYGDATQNAWQVFRDDLKAAQNPQQALQIIFDTYAQHTALTEAARAQVDELGRYAASLPSGSAERATAWGQKWQKTQELYTKLADDVGQLFTGTRAKLNGVADTAAPAFDWWKAIERYTNYDEMAVQQGRAGALGLGAPSAENAAAYQAGINANRQFVDKSMLELYDAFRRNPTQESMDMLVHAQQKVQEMGAQVAAHLDNSLQDALAGKLPWDEYYRLKAQTWHEFFDNAVAHNKAVQRYVVADGITNQYKQALTWDDPFYGPQRLIAPDTEKVVNKSAEAQRNMAMNTGVRQPRETSYNVWQVMDQNGNMQSLPDKYVPDNVKEAWNKIVNNDGDVQAVMDDIAKNTQMPTTTAPEVAPAASVTTPAPEMQAPTAAPVAQQYGPIDNPNKGGMVGVRRTAEGDEPITIFGKSYTKDGVDYYSISGTPEKVPADQLYMLNNKNQLYSVNDIGQIKQAEEAAGRAGDELAGYQDARKAMRDEWYKVAKAEGGYLNLDSAATLYNKGGIVSVPENKFEDLYGKVIAGQQINSQEDVNRFIQDYVDMQAQIKKAEKAAKEAKTVHKAYKLNYEEPANAQDIRNAVKQWNPFGLEAEEAVATKAAQPMSEATGLAKGEEALPKVHPQQEQLNKVIADNTSKSLAQNGTKAPEVSQVMGQHMIEKLQAAEQQILAKLPDMLAGKPNTLTEAQRVGAMDLLQKLLQGYDNAVMQGKASAEAGMNFAMLNYNDRRNIDSILGYVFPYHFYYTRSGINWGIRALQKPGVLHAYNEVQKATELENKQSNLPARLYGTWQNPAAQFGIGPDRIGNPLTWLLPIASYAGSDYVNPEDAQSDYERWYLSVKKFAPSMAPLLDAGVNYGLDKVSPLPNGEKRFQASNYGPAKFVPALNIAGQAYQAATGNTAPQLPGGMGPLWGDKFDPYRVGRMATELAMQQKLDPNTAKYAQQMALNQANGAPMFDKVPKEYQAAAQTLYQQAVPGAAKDRLLASAGSFLTGVPGYNYPPEEQKMQAASKEYGKLGYGPNNEFGSKTAQKEFIKQNDYLPAWWSKSALVPGTDAQAPGASAQQSQAMDAQTALYGAGDQAVDAMLKQNPKATKQDIYNARLGGVAQQAENIVGKDALAEFAKTHPNATPTEIINFVKSTKWPDAAPAEGSGDPTKGMNPQEQQQYEIDQKLRGVAKAQPPQYPGDNATKEQKAAYYKAMNEYEANQEQAAQEALVQSSGEHGRPLLTAEEAEKAWQDYKTRNMTTAEKTRVEQIEQEKAAKQAEWEKKHADWQKKYPNGLPSNKGNEYAGDWQKYLGLDRAGKAQYMLDHPEFAKYYIGKYGKGAAWWATQGHGQGKGFTPRAYPHYGGGGGFGGGGRSGGGGHTAPPQVYARQMDKSLIVQAPQANQAWRPQKIDLSWLHAGDYLAADKLKSWKK